jgi:hypothetical protein
MARNRPTFAFDLRRRSFDHVIEFVPLTAICLFQGAMGCMET